MAVMPAPNESAPGDASQRHLLRRAATVGLLMRNCINLWVCLVALADPGSKAQPVGKWLLVVLACWSAYRIATRSPRGIFLAADYAMALAVCAGTPMLVADNGFYLANSAPQAIAGTAVISFSVVVSPYLSLPMTVGVAVAYAWGAAEVVDWANVWSIAALYYFFLQWTTSSLIRLTLLRVASAVDRARTDRLSAEVNQQVAEAVREYEREQLALLHDTAASTLLMVGQGTSLPPQRLAAQARHDLELLDEEPWQTPPATVELVGALRRCAEHLATPVRFDGCEQLWVNGGTAKAMIAAAREAMNNVDRHARATRLRLTVFADRVVLEDDGVGFDPARPRSGHGVTDSIIGRMARAGGHADIRSAPGSGTVTELSWRQAVTDSSPANAVDDPDRLIERIRVRYGLALTAYAIANLAFMMPYALTHSHHRTAQLLLGVAAGVSTLAAIPGLCYGWWRLARPAAALLMAVTVAQGLLLPTEMVGGQAHWAQSVIGWCLLPLLLSLPTRHGAGLLILYWLVDSAVEVICVPSTSVLVNIGIGTASILGVQLFALTFNGLMRDAAADVQAETQAHQHVMKRSRVAEALHDEYRRRFASVVDNVVPLLQALTAGEVVDEPLQRRARGEARRLRTLFDQASTFDHPLMRELRRLVDAAEARHVDVVVDTAGELPTLTASEMSRLADPLARILDATTASARIVIQAERNEISASVVCHGMSDASAACVDGDADLDVVVSDDMVWYLIRQRLQEGAGDHVLAGSSSAAHRRSRGR
jgi:signal transduction histidine kinase